VSINCTAVKTVDFWDAMLCGLAGGYQPAASIFRVEKCEVEEDNMFHQNTGNYQPGITYQKNSLNIYFLYVYNA
jgi:hypothetical protein